MVGKTNGSGTAWTKRSIDSTFNGAASVVVADLDKDGDLDVIGAAATDNDIAWWKNETIHSNVLMSTAQETKIDSTAQNFYSEAVDLDGDGDQDIVVKSNGELFWLDNTAGDGSAWTRNSISTGNFTTFTASIGDIDGDGDLDIVIPNKSGQNFYWFENTAGDASVWTQKAMGSA